MYTSVRQIVKEGKLGKWIKMSEEEMQCVVESIPGENMLRNAHMNKMDGSSVGDNLRHYIDRGFIVVSGQADVEKHPLDVEKKTQEDSLEKALAAGAREKGVFNLSASGTA